MISTWQRMMLLHPMVLLPASASTTPPNILFVLADDMGYNDVSYHNKGKGIAATFTPTIDKLASEGTKMDSYYVNPICSPSRAAIITGRYTIRTGISHHCYTTMTGLPKNERLLPKAMKDAGYETWLTGKWHLGFSETYMIPSERGFDHTYGFYNACIDAFNHTQGGGGCSADSCKGLDWHRAQAGQKPVPVPEDRGTHTAHLIVSEIDRLLQQRQRQSEPKPLFLFVPFHMIHQASGKGASSWPSGFDAGGLQAPKSYVDAVPESVTDPKRRVFVAMASLLDEAIANITSLFVDHGLWNNTVMIFNSDNGSPFDDRGVSGNLPLRGQKHTLYEGGLRVPAFVRGPGVPAGATVKHLIAHVDWFPTLVGLASGSVDQPLPLDGIDQWKTILGGPAVREEILHNYDQSTKLVEHFKGSLRWNNFKLIRLENTSSDSIGSEFYDELYDVIAVPSETTNLFHNSSMKVVLSTIQARMDQYAAEVVPCWCDESSAMPGVCAGKGYTGNCDVHQPVCNASTPDFYAPGWCTDAKGQAQLAFV
jgi:arylsulfatase B/arylsulfatase I/J